MFMNIVWCLLFVSGISSSVIPSQRGISTRLVVREGQQTELPCDIRPHIPNEAGSGNSSGSPDGLASAAIAAARASTSIQTLPQGYPGALLGLSGPVGGANQSSLALVRWFHTPDKKTHHHHHVRIHHQPVYTVDFGTEGSAADAQRSNNILQVSRSASKTWSGRAYFSLLGHPALLKVNEVRFEDSGLYTCSAVFRDGSIINSTVRLHVVAPPEPPQIRDGYDTILIGTVGPFNEGSPLSLVCLVYGGRPKPTLEWSGMRPSALFEIRHSQEAQLTTATLVIHRLEREDLGSTLTCSAFNNISSAQHTSVTLDLNLKPVGVKIRRLQAPISAGLRVEVVCEVFGSRPQATVSWWKGLKQLNQTFEYTSSDGNVTTSVVTFTPSASDHGSNIACRATNPSMDSESAEEDTWKIAVQYAPRISLALGSKLNAENIVENSDVYLDCGVDAFPAADDVHWTFEGKDLIAGHNVIISKHFLVIQQVQTQHSGFYSCHAENSEGRSQADSLFLRVLHAPVCSEDQHVLYAATRHQAIEVHCQVEADPSNVTFEWFFHLNGNSQQGKKIEAVRSQGTLSIATYTAHGHGDFGTLTCQAKNRIGEMKEPCVFHVVPAGPPPPLQNCSISNQTQEAALHLTCISGPESHLPQRFFAEVLSVPAATVVANFSNARPEFWLDGLAPSTEYQIRVWAANDHGRSNVATLLSPVMPHVGKLTESSHPFESLSSSALTLSVLIAAGMLLCLLLPAILLTVLRLHNTAATLDDDKKTETQTQSNDFDPLGLEDFKTGAVSSRELTEIAEEDESNGGGAMSPMAKMGSLDSSLGPSSGLGPLGNPLSPNSTLGPVSGVLHSTRSVNGSILMPPQHHMQAFQDSGGQLHVVYPKQDAAMLNWIQTTGL
ncbi:neogenin-like [Varroa destructor]|uniref:Ig-like domain-containing protein n=1 Tax=Varroa destructor TaxID=109461 RepID=A0A7M7KCH7_VARDE|nr:neogenin-like [Varroa destructor]